ncbi:MAG: hypothetical protein IPJ97_02820 [Proteobacteria bacterium]|nr:hypothetical protein [Pseudomonadota bacterium]
MHKVFISGSMSIENLDANVVDRLGNVIESDYQVLVGDADGVDSAIQKHLRSKQTSNVVIYCAGEKPRNNFGDWIVERISTLAKPGTREFFTEKDLKMADVCDYGFMIWDTKSTGTLRNVIELLKRGKYSLVYINKKKAFKKVKSIGDFEELLENMSEKSLKKAEDKLRLSAQLGQLKHVQSDLF